MIDAAAAKTEKRLKKIEKHLEDLYKQSQKDVTKAWREYMNAQDSYIKDLNEAYGRAKDFGTAEEVREIGRELGVAKAERTLKNDYYKDMVAETTRKISSVNEQALAYVNGQMFWVYADNYNQAAKDCDKIGVTFNLVDEATVRRRVMDGNIKLPKKKINVPKDMRWNTKQLNSSVLQGIVNGESMQKIADRILPVVNNNAASAIRNARTMVTGAQNEGRMDSYKQMEEMGVAMKKVWMATPDDRTRESHLELDGEEVDVNEPFSNGLMYPGDPSGAPEEVYNCRCTMVTDIIGFRKDDGRIEPIAVKDVDSEHEQQIEDERERREEPAAQSSGIFAPEAYTQDRKDNAVWAQTADKADAEFRPTASKAWIDATEEEKDAVHSYTGGSGPQNRPLRGYEGGWHNYKGSENMTITKSEADRINNTTSYIERCSLGKDAWFQRGVESGGAASFLHISSSDFTAFSQDEMEAAIKGKVFRDDAFMSCGTAKGYGFRNNIIFNVYCPAGTKAAYSEPFSVFGNGSGRSWDGLATQSSFGSELETIIQRGSEYMVTKVERAGYGQWYIDMDVVGQDPKPLVDIFKEIKG